jgi:hypothetical protein
MSNYPTETTEQCPDCSQMHDPAEHDGINLDSAHRISRMRARQRDEWSIAHHKALNEIRRLREVIQNALGCTQVTHIHMALQEAINGK